MPSLRFVERMSGTFHVLGTPLVTHAIELDIEAHVRSFRTLVASVTGRIRAAGLADAPVQGTLGLHALGERRIPYDLYFMGESGRRLHLNGEKDLSWLAPVETLVVLHFTIVEDSSTWTELARGTLRFDVRRDFRALARSLRASPF